MFSKQIIFHIFYKLNIMDCLEGKNMTFTKIE